MVPDDNFPQHIFVRPTITTIASNEWEAKRTVSRQRHEWKMLTTMFLKNLKFELHLLCPAEHTLYSSLPHVVLILLRFEMDNH